MREKRGYLVPFQEAESELVEKKSRFLGHVQRVETEEEARAVIDQVQKKYYDARHHCWCYVLHHGNVLRYSDDGEPQGTAGQPMLNVFQQEGVEDVVCVVTRYFGGILLGAGGLTRAYAKSAKDTLDAAGIACMQPWKMMRLDCPYSMLERFKLLLMAQGGVIERADYGATIEIQARVPVERAGIFEKEVTELSAGSMKIDWCGEHFFAKPCEEGK